MSPKDDPVWGQLYPELGSLGGFFEALQVACKREQTDVVVDDSSCPPVLCASMALADGDGPRVLRVSVNRNAHGFVVECREGEHDAVRGQVGDVVDVARVACDWLRDQRASVDMNATPRLAVTKQEAKRVFGETVETYWWLPLQPFSWASSAHRAALERTKEMPELRQLVSILSMNDLLFCECTEAPWPLRAPWLRIITGASELHARYEVRLGQRRFDQDRSTLLGVGDLDTAIGLVRDNLPTDLRLAIVGDGFDLHPEVTRPIRDTGTGNAAGST